MPTFRKKPVVIEARQLTHQSFDEVAEWCRGKGNGDPLFISLAPYLFIETLEGPMRAQIGDWIIKGVQGEFYPCKSDIFEATYEVVE